MQLGETCADFAPCATTGGDGFRAPSNGEQSTVALPGMPNHMREIHNARAVHAREVTWRQHVFPGAQRLAQKETLAARQRDVAVIVLCGDERDICNEREPSPSAR